MTMAGNSARVKCTPTAGTQEKHSFANVAPHKHIERMQGVKDKYGALGIALSELWLGVAAQTKADGSIDIGFACHDGTYSVDFAVHTLNVNSATVDDEPDPYFSSNRPSDTNNHADAFVEYLVGAIRNYQQKNQYKFLGAGLSQEVIMLDPQAPVRLWGDLDIVPVVIQDEQEIEAVVGVDEQADSLARKCLSYFGPSSQPRVQVGFSNLVNVDLGGRAPLTAPGQYQQTVTDRTWKAAMKYAELLKQGGKKFAFFSATPQGGGVALMRHALIRFFRLLDVDCTWWVPKPKPEVFRITKTNHNILQGVADPNERLTKEQQETISLWISSNAERFWTQPGRPLASRSQGGVDVVIVDDPQMPGIIDIAKRMDPDRPVIFRSHIQIRSDLAEKPGTPTAEVWDWLWRSVQQADLFISHPVKSFVPHTVEMHALAYMPATTDWLDGLNKGLSDFDTAYYIHEFNAECQRQRMVTLDYPKRDYIIQIARFDPSKGVPHVLASYAEFRRNSQFCRGKKAAETPQLVVCGHHSVDDPDGVAVLNETLDLLDSEYSDIKDSIVVMRLGPVDQLLNALLSNARVALQLSTREGFEVKVSEALHKGVPVVATTAGGIPLQVQHEKSGFLVEPGDAAAVGRYLDLLFSDEQRYRAMCTYAAAHVSDEVSTVGNALCWMYLADRMSRTQERLKVNGRWVWDLAREEAGQPKNNGREDWLPRNRTT